MSWTIRQRGLHQWIYATHPAPASVSLSLGGNFGSENRSPGGFGSGKCLQCSCTLVVKHISLQMRLELLDVIMSVFYPSWRRHFGVRPGSHGGLKQPRATKYVVFSGTSSCSFDSWGQGFLTNLGSDKEAHPVDCFFLAPVHLTCSLGTSTSPPPLFLASLIPNFFVMDIFAILLIHVIYFNLFLKLPTYLGGIMQWNVN